MCQTKLLLTGLFASACCLCSCQTTTTAPPAGASDADLTQLAQWMTGTFSSAAQAKADPENYFDIRLVMIPIWVDRDDGPWLYVEQAAAESLDRPYRQRVYRLSRENEASLRSEAHLLPGNPMDYVACWRGDDPLGDLTPDDLISRDGCAVILLRHDEQTFAGATVGSDCKSTLNGAAYATSDIVITPDRVVSWDQGWDENGNQVWGATQGGYVFNRIADGAPN